MPAFYQHELDFMVRTLKKMRLAVHMLCPGDQLNMLDDGLRVILGMEDDYATAFQITLQWSNKQTIYKIMDQFMCHYIYFHLPQTSPPTAMVIGPYLTTDPTREMILEQTERLGLPMHLLPHQADYYAALPVFNDPSAIMAVVSSFGEVLWGSAGSFDLVDVNYERRAGAASAVTADTPIEQSNILQQMKLMEERYAYENELMEIVSKGLINRAEMMMSSVSMLNYQQRHADPLRNMKNYCIISNTILRKAAQQGGVHPLHLDRISSQYARTIENSPTLDHCRGLIGDMIRNYCRLVRTHAGLHYSAIVQKTQTYISANLSADLSLTTLAELMNVSPGYLSTLFHQETGQTLTQYITDQRMKTALQLLSSSRLQVQTIAQLCGFSDPNYFGKQFKRHYGFTPAKYRQEQLRHPSPADV